MVKAIRNRTFRLETNQLDMVLWQNLYYKYQIGVHLPNKPAMLSVI